MLGVRLADLLDYFRHLLRVALIVECEAETGGTVDNGLAELGALLADAAGEDEGINVALEAHKVGADVA